MSKMFSFVYGAQTVGIGAKMIRVEADVTKGGLQSFAIVGLPDKAVEESRDRVNAAIKNSGFTGPKQGNTKTIISLAPADVRKEGPLFDLPIALSYLLATKQILFDTSGKIFFGELSLSGELHGIKGVLPLVQKAKENGFTEVFLPMENIREAALIDGIKIYGAKDLCEVVEHLNEKKIDAQGNMREKVEMRQTPRTRLQKKNTRFGNDFGEIKGQETAKRALLIAAAGGHNIAMYGPPGTGKTMLARAFAAILPELSFDNVLEVTGIHSIAGILDRGLVTSVPFRSPHHSASFVSLVGGGATLRPGEVTLAHRGVLFLDEFPEFDRRAIEALRQPIEDARVNVTRARGSVTYPANFILIAAMNPCPCGNFGSDVGKACVCTPAELMRYRRKMSGPIMDRIDIWVQVGKVDPVNLGKKGTRGESQLFREKVEEARKIQETRFANRRADRLNSDMTNHDIEENGKVTEDAKNTLLKSMKTMDLSARGYFRVLKTARTIADLGKSETIETSHILEALQYRPRNF